MLNYSRNYAAGHLASNICKTVIVEVVRLAHVKRGFVLLPRRWVVERSFGWAARFRRLARDYERLTATLEGMHYIAFCYLMLHKAAPHFCWSS
jgi:transposase